ncbi:hypothetical protein [Haloplanus halobius]|uniref:hypothetical protein n=1 Tax=Haloplanus halobius TaxID=2934938 RepID=UPI00200FD0DD|nr:hypothetical protein [Haloplanus sp. XH21]
MTTMQDNTIRVILNSLFVFLSVLVLWPGAVAMKDIQATVFNWPFFAFWEVIVGPLLLIALFIINSEWRIRNDKQLAETGGEQ